jgi:hypothetical protein
MSRLLRLAKAEKKSKSIKSEIHAYKRKMRIVSLIVTLVILFSLIVLFSYYLLAYFAVFSSSKDDGDGTSNNDGNGTSNSTLLKAALVDALYSDFPNDYFTSELNHTLQAAGYSVDVFQGTNVTVDFLKDLPTGYKLIVLRLHSAPSDSGDLYFFTAEPYSVGAHTQEQQSRLVKAAYAREDSQSVFAVNWAFIRVFMEKELNGTLVVAMGCDGTLDEGVIREFKNQGAVGYVGWTGPVSLSHSDTAVLHFVKDLYERDMSFEQAVEDTNRVVGADPTWGARLECYRS